MVEGGGKLITRLIIHTNYTPHSGTNHTAGRMASYIITGKHEKKKPRDIKSRPL